MPKPQIFISRDLQSNSPFVQLLADKAALQGLSLIDFEAISFSQVPQSDWWFFYSQRGMDFFFQQQAVTPDSAAAIAVMGAASANYLKEQYGLAATFVGQGKPSAIATQFTQVAHGQSALFIQAKHSKASVQQLLPNTISQESLIVYNNTIKTVFSVKKADILVFTSPLNVQAYFGRYAYAATQQVISIGRTTGAALQVRSIPFILAKHPQETALAKACLDLI